MNDLQLSWLLPTIIQSTGIGLALGIFGFIYEDMLLNKKPFFIVLGQGSKIYWLAVSAALFALGLGFSRAHWIAKDLAIALAAVLLEIAWLIKRNGTPYRKVVTKARLTFKSVALRVGPAVVGIVLLLVLVWVLDLGWHAYHLYGLARDFQQNPTQLTPQSLPPLVGSVSGDVHSLHTGLRPLFPIFNALQALPQVGPYLGQVDPLLTYADGLAQAGEEILTGLEPLLEGADNPQGDLPLPERLSQVMGSGQQHFLAANQSIQQAAGARSKIRPDLLPPQIEPLYTELDQKFNLLEAGGQFLIAAANLLGNDQAQNYLVLAQNRDELRATGGFISGIGLVTVQKGKILQFSLGDSYAIDDFTKSYPAPPDALKRFMLADYWVARDANWSPDFPTTAMEAQSLYTLSTGVETQGVIAFNQLAVQKVLEVIGPVQVPGTQEPVTAENVESYMRQSWAPAPEEGLSQEWWLHRKDFMQQLGNVIIEEVLKSADMTKLLCLGKAAIDLLERGQLLIYFDAASAQSALEQANLDNALHTSNADFLYLVDSNIGFNKVDSVIARSLAYQVDLSDIAHPTGKATLTYQHTGAGNAPCVQEASYGTGTYQDLQQRCYWDYWRLYSPEGSKLLSSDAQPVPGKELLNPIGWSGQVESLDGEGSTQVFAGVFVLPISKTSQVDVTYSLPASVLRAAGENNLLYSLSIDVQPGLTGLPFTLVIIPPPSVEISFTDEGWQPGASNSWVWQGVLQKPTELTLTFTQDQ